MPNRLQHETSPYLLQHADNPVDWFPWGTEALERAKKENKPIFLSIGYAACHWCHVMAHESFEDPETAAMMNHLYVNIKVDREERPDLDSIYMDAVVGMTGQGGWPMSVFLTPEGEPFFGGTYFPPVRRYNMPAFKEILQSVANAWQAQRDELIQNAKKLIAHLTPPSASQQNFHPLTKDLLDQAAMVIAQNYDWKFGGWGKAPKFPQPMIIMFLLRRSVRGDTLALQIAEHALEAMQRGGMYDVIGGGFARYSTDNHWLVPHFEKMLYDNAQLALAYLHAYLITGKGRYREVCEQTLDFVLREMTHAEGGFFSSLDADSEGEEGKFYTWTLEEIQQALSTDLAANLWAAAYGVSSEGNYEGYNIFQRKLSDAELADQFALTEQEVKKLLNLSAQELLELRSKRVRPATDDKILTGWNGLMMRAFAEAGRYLNVPRFINAAAKNAAFLERNLYQSGGLMRSWRDQRANIPAFQEDYSALIYGLLAFYQTNFDNRWFKFAENLANEMLQKFSDPNGGFFDTSLDQESLIIRPKSIQDNAVPSGNAVAAQALLELYALTGNQKYLATVDQMWQLVTPAVDRYPTAFGHWLIAADFAVSPTVEVAVLHPDQADLKPFLEIVNQQFRPQSVLAVSAFPPSPDAPPLLQDRNLLEGRTTAFVCKAFICDLPVNDPDAFKMQIEKSIA